MDLFLRFFIFYMLLLIFTARVYPVSVAAVCMLDVSKIALNDRLCYAIVWETLTSKRATS